MDNSKLVITPLGAGNEVGRSCIHLTYMDTQILLDCGIHPAYAGFSSLPYLDLVDLTKIDAVFISHFHLDHGGALPFLTEKTGFKGSIFMTHPTKIILKWLLNDYIRILNTTADTDINDNDLKSCIDKITCIDYYQEIRIKSFKITALNAGHVLGAAMFQIEIKRSVLLYTGDYSREEDRHLKAADLPTKKIGILICESTYGVGCHLPKKERESRFIDDILQVLSRNGRVLLPVFALGRAQELLLIMEEYWESNNLSAPIYYVSALAKKCMNVYQTYLNMMNERIQKVAETKNPFLFNHVKNIQTLNGFVDESCVMVASPGMLQSGTSRELFEKWCEDERNGVIITGYCVNGTLAKEILSEPSHITSLGGQKLKLNMRVSFISFSAHVDFIQNAEFIAHCDPKHLIFVHGEVNEMTRLRNAIVHKNTTVIVEMLKNGEQGNYDIEEDLRAKINNDLLGESGEIEGVLLLNYDAEIKEDVGIKFKQKKRVLVKDGIVKRNLILNYFKDFEFGEDRDVYINEIRVVFEDDAILLMWDGSFRADLTAMTIVRLIEQENLEMIKFVGKREALLNLLRNYYEIKVDKNEILVMDGLNIVKIVDGVVCGGTEVIRNRIERIVEIVNRIYN